MNRLARSLTLCALLSWLAAMPAAASAAQAQGHAQATPEEFFIVSSIDPLKHQIFFKRPTEVTLLMDVDARTSYVDEQGKSIQLTSLRAGDTVWVVSTEGKSGRVALHIRKGPMTIQELHRLYLPFQ